MTTEEITLAGELSRSRFVPGSWEKRFARDMGAIARESPQKDLTTRQARWLRILHHKFRRQIPSHRCGSFCRIEELPGAIQ